MLKREINFTTDKYHKPVYLSKRDSVAQVVINGLFMKKGNLPSHPDRGVDIEQYIGKPAESVDELAILSDLRRTCGDELVGTELQGLTFSTVKIDDEETTLILIKLLIDNQEDLLAIFLQRRRDSTVRYDYHFINDDVPI